MKLDKKLAQTLTIGLGLAVLFVESFEVALITFGIAAILYGFTQSLEVMMVVILAPLAIKGANILLKPTKTEPFQVKDAKSVSDRVINIKQGEPLKPRVAEPTGVLESPNIMSSEPLLPIGKLAAEALPGASVPAAASARVQIFTPDEITIPATGMRVSAPFANPVLQNGPDAEGLDMALAKTGAMMVNGPADVAGVAGGAGKAF